MAAPTTTAAALRMKLLIDTKSRRVLFAEAGKDAVDFLFSLLTLPLATAAALLGAGSAPGSVGTLYASVERLDDSYLLPGADKGALLRPALAVSPAATASSSLLLPPPPPAAAVVRRAVEDLLQVRQRLQLLLRCHRPMTAPLQYVSPSAAGPGGGYGQRAPQDAFAGGFVQGVVTYTVMDDLTVTPMSTISSITLLNAFAVTDLAALQEKTVWLGYREGLAILKASLQSKTVLTDVFLGSSGRA
ncbi:unnamed protein product [Urochloa decumbens]|uniref:Uncharacterized protein n=1 Tax=Urochloa decumbens TaxID=240449 RepID=A0ABC8ZD68_9POAL